MKEKSSIEFKSSFNDSAIETLSAFANTKGDKVLIGVDNNGKPIKAFKIGHESIQQWINEIKNKPQPTIIADAEILKLQGQEIVELSIPEFPIKPVAFKSRYYKRVRNSNHAFSGSEISDLYLQSLQLSWDSYPFKAATFKQLQISKIKQFIKRVNESGRFSLPLEPNAALVKLKLVTNSKRSNAAMILFSSHTPFYNVHVGRFKSPSLIIDDRMINDNLFDVVEESMRFIVGHLKVAFEIAGKTPQRNEIFEYPITAIRELLLNALIHRDYKSSSD